MGQGEATLTAGAGFIALLILLLGVVYLSRLTGWTGGVDPANVTAPQDEIRRTLPTKKGRK